MSTTFKDLQKRCLDTYEEKNANYGNSFDKSCEKYGLMSFLVRFSDKFNRAEQLILNNSLKGVSGDTDESLCDTLLDTANYCLMAVMFIENHNKLKENKNANEPTEGDTHCENSDGSNRKKKAYEADVEYYGED